MRLLIVDEHLLLADALRVVLEERGEKVDIAADGGAGVALARAGHPDVALVELTLSGEGGLSVGRRIIAASPETKVVALTGAVDASLVTETLKAGFHAFLTKSTPLSQVVAALDAVTGGQTVLPHHVAASVAGHRSDVERDALLMADQLTDRERAVLSLLVAGASTTAIAREFALSRNTVRSYVQNILIKLQVHSRLEAAAFAVRFRLVETIKL